MRTGCEKVGGRGVNAVLLRSGGVRIGRADTKNLVFFLMELCILVGEFGPSAYTGIHGKSGL